jgi:hypothetical protein
MLLTDYSNEAPTMITNLFRRANSGDKRAMRQERARLAAELASYRTEAERTELFEILDRHSTEDSAPIRKLLR